MRRSLFPLIAVIGVLLGAAAPAQAQLTTPLIQQSVGIPVFPVTSMSRPPAGFSANGARALAVAETSPVLQRIHRHEHPLVYQVQFWIGSHYEVMFFYRGKAVADVLVSPAGRLGKTFTGPLIDGVYARGGYAPLFDSPWVVLPFGLMFVLPFLRRPRGLSLRHLDLAALLSFGVSYYLFDHARLVAAVWLVYPPLLYLLGRMLVLGARRSSTARPSLRSWLPARVLAAGLIALLGARIGLALAAPHVIDVGYASVIGAYRILHGAPLYYVSLAHPDTYGPLAYLAYVPFEALWPWHGTWDYLPAARAAAISFDVLTVLGLLVLGRRLRAGRDGWRLGLLLAWVWAANPFSLLGVMAGTDDGLIALALVLVLLAITSPLGRGALLGLAAAAKFFPALLLAVVAVGPGGGDRRRTLLAAGGFTVAVCGSFALFLPPGGIQELYNHTIGYQLGRSDIFSIWALHPTLSPVKYAVEAGAFGLAGVLAFWPRGVRTTPQVSALMAAVVIAVQLPGVHWFYYYIMWFLPLVAVAVLASEPRGQDAAPVRLEEPAAAAPEPPSPVLAGAA